MQFAIINNDRVEPFSGGRGQCPQCASVVIAKCGPRVIHHWAHLKIRNCDPWWKNETPWHREWKNLFPIECREISHIADDGEIHRADIKTPTGIVIEIQHSSMTDAERQSRENFYKNIAWIIDGSEFKNNFDIYHRLPNPHSEIAQDIVWVKAKRNLNGANYGLFFRLSEARAENPGIVKSKVRSGTIYDIRELQASLDESYNGYHQFDWVRPRKTWLDSRHPVYIDFGGENLVRLCMYDESELSCIQYVSKKKFLHDALNESRAVDIATRFYPLPL